MRHYIVTILEYLEILLVQFELELEIFHIHGMLSGINELCRILMPGLCSPSLLPLLRLMSTTMNLSWMPELIERIGCI